jgi:hypothetical protein
METFHIFTADGGWEAYREGTTGVVTGPHPTAFEAIDAVRVLHPGRHGMHVHRHHINEACAAACERMESGD